MRTAVGVIAAAWCSLFAFICWPADELSLLRRWSPSLASLQTRCRVELVEAYEETEATAVALEPYEDALFSFSENYVGFGRIDGLEAALPARMQLDRYAVELSIRPSRVSPRGLQMSVDASSRRLMKASLDRADGTLFVTSLGRRGPSSRTLLLVACDGGDVR